MSGEPDKAFRTQHPLKVVGEVLNWTGHAPEALKTMRDALENLKRRGIEAIND